MTHGRVYTHLQLFSGVGGLTHRPRRTSWTTAVRLALIKPGLGDDVPMV